MNGNTTPLRYRRINRRNGSIQKIKAENYASKKGIPPNVPLSISPQRVINNDFSPLNLQQFKEELGIRKDEKKINTKDRVKRPLNIEDILGGNTKTYKDDIDNSDYASDDREKAPVLEDFGNERPQFNDPGVKVRERQRMRDKEREKNEERLNRRRMKKDIDNHEFYNDTNP